MIDTVLFDFGRVISAPKPPALFARYEQELGLAAGTINDIMFASDSWQQALVGTLSMDDYWLRIGPQLGLHDEEAIRAFQDRYYGDERLDGGTRSIIVGLAAAYTLGIISNHPKGLGDWLERWNLRQFFQVVTVSGEVGFAKPDRRIFIHTLRAIDREPRRTVFIDDCDGHVRAARQCGMHGLLFTDAGRLAADLSALGIHCR